MIFYVNGDSHSAGTDAGGINASYGRYISNALNFRLFTDATAGASNFKILRTTREFLKKQRPDLVIIGWTTWEREEWVDQNGKRVQVNAGPVNVPIDLRDKYKEWVITATSPEFLQERENFFHNEIYKLHSDLKNENIPHLFFNTYLYFQYIKDLDLPKFDWGNNFVNPYEKESTFYYWLENQGFFPIKNNHFGKEGHDAWANFLIQRLTYIL
jgi:hypothetical protein